MDADLLCSSMDGEMISNIEQPSLHMLTSDESVDETERIIQHCNNFTFKSSTPLRAISSVNTVATIDNDDDVKIDYVRPPSAFPSSRCSKRYSLTTFNETGACYAINKSNSMQDVSSIGSFCPLRRNSCMYSNETLQSNSIATTTHTKDSGFQRSNSCTSLTTNASKKYDHVQSKVKQYIRNIKQTEALHKMQKRMIKNEYTLVPMQAPELCHLSAGTDTTVTVVSKRKLLDKLKELEEELREKDCVIEELEKNQSELRLKYAAAENQIDDLRIRASIYEDPLKKYVSDEKIAQLLTSDDQQTTKISKKYRVESGVARKLIKNMAAASSLEASSSVPASEFTVKRRSMPICHVNQLQPSKKYTSNCSRLKDEFPVLKSSNGVSKSSSCKQVEEARYKLTKSASNIDRLSVTFAALPIVSGNDIVDLPYEKNSFAKVQHWQRSLLANAYHDGKREATETVPIGPFYYNGTDNVDGDGDGGNNNDGDDSDVFAGASTSSLHHRCNIMATLNNGNDENDEVVVVNLSEGKHRNKSSSTSRRYQKNKDSDKKQHYRKSYPVGCRCDKFKCKPRDIGGGGSGGGDARKETSNTSTRLLPNRGKLLRSVSFANYEDSLTSSIYADGESSSSSDSSSSSSSSSSIYATKRKLKSYKVYKQQRKLLQTKLANNRGGGGGGGDNSCGRDPLPKWNEMKKAKSAQNIRSGKEYSRGGTGRDYNSKRVLDSSSTSQDYSCSDRKHCDKSHQKKYRKLDDCSRMLPVTSSANATGASNVLVKCKSRHGCDHHRTNEYDRSSASLASFYDISRSKSCESRHGRKHDAKDKGRRSSKYDCSCLTGLENLKIQEHNTLAKFAAAECFRKTHQQKLQQMET